MTGSLLPSFLIWDYEIVRKMSCRLHRGKSRRDRAIPALKSQAPGRRRGSPCSTRPESPFPTSERTAPHRRESSGRRPEAGLIDTQHSSPKNSAIISP